MIFSLLLIFVLTLAKSSSAATIEPAPVRRVYHTQIHPRQGALPYNYPPPLSRSQTKTSPNVSHIQTSPASPAKSTAASHRGTGDPCGPAGRQTDFESTLNTCGAINTTYTHAPSIYGVQCLNANPSWNQSINITSCTSNIEYICDAITSGKVTVSEWNWSSGGPNCTVGIWFNPLPAWQPSLSWTMCYNDIFQLMQSTCFPSEGGQFNVAAVNLQTLPGVGTTGSQVDSGYLSYIMVPETYDNTYADLAADEVAPVAGVPGGSGGEK